MVPGCRGDLGQIHLVWGDDVFDSGFRVRFITLWVPDKCGDPRPSKKRFNAASFVWAGHRIVAMSSGDTVVTVNSFGPDKLCDNRYPLN